MLSIFSAVINGVWFPAKVSSMDIEFVGFMPTPHEQEVQ